MLTNLFLKYMGTRVYGLHSIDWKKFKVIDVNNNIKLHDTHQEVKEKYSLDVIQFNRVLYAFPQLLNIYRKNILGLYRFNDKEELEIYKKTINQTII